MNKLAIVIAIAGTVLSGCSLAPTYVQPTRPVAEFFPYQSQISPATNASIQTRFADPRLQMLVDSALLNNKDLRIATLNIMQARAQYQIQRADRLPTVNGSIGYTRQRGDETAYLSTDEITSTHNLGVGISSYELDLFGRVKNLTDAALREYLAIEANQRAVRLSLIAEVATAYLNQRSLAERIDVARRTVRIRTEEFDLITNRVHQGLASELTLSQSEASLEEAKADAAALEREMNQSDNNIALLVGGPLPASIPDPLPLEQQKLDEALPGGLSSTLLERRPDIIAAEQRLIASYANIGAARAAFFPRISLTAAVGSSSTQLDDLFAGSSRYWTFAPSISIPIFNHGRNQAALEVAQVRKDLNVAEYEKTIEVAFREVSDELGARAPLERQLKAKQAQLEAAQRSARISAERYSQGLDGYLDSLDSQRQLYQVETALIQTKLLLGVSQIRLIKSLGGDWQGSLPLSASATRTKDKR